MMAQGVDSSTYLSAYMARGCLSPRTVYKAAVALARDTAADEATCKGAACLIMHLQIRCPHTPAVKIGLSNTLPHQPTTD